MRISAKRYTTYWIKLEIGIAMGCIISPVLFAFAMEVIHSVAEGNANPTDLESGCNIRSLKTFIDNFITYSPRKRDSHDARTCYNM
ncbi:reverse transcriptase [Plakobranchus ocellatus]|uniref:Reverse transcriptase n=1 Tax=Plakobranchus ocellatus TaxID=259542 RepID=A0AAV3XH45_9GAST|nr:reverse transcriptase [Plakobranchus ocellatus]